MAEIYDKALYENFEKKLTNLPVPYSYYEKQGFFRCEWLTWSVFAFCNTKVIVIFVCQSKINNT